MIQRKEFFISCDGIRLHCKLDRPAPSPAEDPLHPAQIPMILVIPGLTGDMEEAQIVACAQALAENGYASLRVELYGHGKSGGSFRDHTLFHWALELMCVIDYARKLDYVSELYLCGHSQGGSAAVLAAGLKPDVLSGLILLAPSIGIKESSLNGGFPKRFFDPDHIPDETKVFDNDVISGNYYRVNRLLPFDDAIALYGDRPVLVIHAVTDEFVPYRCGVRAAESYRNSELITIEEDDHCFGTHIDLVTGAMIRFLERLRGQD